jgi:hypothetical protein
MLIFLSQRPRKFSATVMSVIHETLYIQGGRNVYTINKLHHEA